MVVAQIVWLTPAAALVGLAALVPLAAWLLGEWHVRRARETLGLRADRRATWWAPAAIAVTLGLVAVTAAQPTLASSGGRSSQRTGQVFVVIDSSASMRAGRPMRFARATAAAVRIRDDLVGTPVGLASVTDRVLPHIFPTIDREDYLATLHQALGIDRPPPSKARRQASTYGALSVLGSARFFANTKGPRVAVLLTDGETREFDPGAVARALTHARVKLVIVRFWKAGERIAGDPVYRADQASAIQAQAIATQMQVPTFDEDHLGDALRAVRGALGNQQRRMPPRATSTSRPLAPFAMMAALVPLGLLVWRRNLS
jgi:hypothetical protein